MKSSLLEENLRVCEQENNFLIPKGRSGRNTVTLKTKQNQPKNNKSKRKKSMAKYSACFSSFWSSMGFMFGKDERIPRNRQYDLNVVTQ